MYTEREVSEEQKVSYGAPTRGRARTVEICKLCQKGSVERNTQCVGRNLTGIITSSRPPVDETGLLTPPRPDHLPL